uniref:Uncharacterized protein n=1 Tax=Timema poppense TaxID=170557 RepID=A0A7R9H452_TIMPO|nr:unnamed protein product [Timema poppensis]
MNPEPFKAETFDIRDFQPLFALLLAVTYLPTGDREEYVAENIKWTPIEYFNNKVVCDLIESKRPPGLFSVLDDVCATMHAVSEGVDSDLQKQMTKTAGGHQHYQSCSEGFIIHHYAGIVTYNVEGFCDRNRDLLFPDLIELMQSSENEFIRSLFPDQLDSNSKLRPTTSGSKIRTQANKLVDELKKCTPHYIRCIKPNETKKPRDWEELRVKHQVEYLGLKENIRVRRAGFAYRRPFSKFLFRYAILTKETWPRWSGDEKQGIEVILRSVNMEKSQYQLGKTKVFIKAPESLFMLEDQRERKYNQYARVIQAAFKKYFARKKQQLQKQEAAVNWPIILFSDIMFGKKERRRFSINRNFVGDYIGLDSRPMLQSIIGRREKVAFAEVVKKYDRRFKVCLRDLILTSRSILLVGRAQVRKGPEKGKFIEVLKRKLDFENINDVSLSTLQDDFIILHMKEDYDSLLEVVFKTEFLMQLAKKYKAQLSRDLNVKFSNSLEFRVKKEGWGGGGTRQVKFSLGPAGDLAVLKSSGKVLMVIVGQGLPNNSKPIIKRTTSSKGRPTYQQKQSVAPVRGQAPGRPAMPAPRAHTSRPVFSVPPPPNEPAPLDQQPIQGFRVPMTAIQAKQCRLFRNESQQSAVDSQSFSPTKKTRGDAQVPKMKTAAATAHSASSRPQQPPSGNQNFMRTPESGMSGEKRASLSSGVKPVPGGGKPRPAMRPKPSLPKCKAMFDYTAQDLDEISFKDGDIIEIIKEPQ